MIGRESEDKCAPSKEVTTRGGWGGVPLAANHNFEESWPANHNSRRRRKFSKIGGISP